MIREPLPSDAGEIRDMYARIGWHYTLEEMRRNLAPCRTFVSIDSTEQQQERAVAVQGSICVCEQKSIWSINGLVVDPLCQGKGIGRVLMQHVLNLAKEAQVPVIVRLVSTTEGMPLYRKLGFQHITTCTLLVRRLAGYARPSLIPVDDGSRFDEAVWSKDAPIIDELSVQATGGCKRSHINRAHLFPGLGISSKAVMIRRAGEAIGFGAVRRTSQFVILGPIVAPSATIAKAVLERLMALAMSDDQFKRPKDSSDATAGGEEVNVRIDVTSDVDVNHELRDWLVNSCGFSVRQDCPLMDWRAGPADPTTANGAQDVNLSQWALLSQGLL
ncbi:acyl-CoA N-acyltransferase [Acaromyces ingoldii]|uniref:Acyl-CoA N-acyltransferase n=1 Tax=Acaromyces ingoldii TaxID=215250 RepID=A0A316YVS1_9BASI|nr:acyl-CoA N-acyltransferase [Acaromyces ingoldii]PWN93650.1 acyl-CoA N-acyltransferase [Acaromyces ingoldii]